MEPVEPKVLCVIKIVGVLLLLIFQIFVLFYTFENYSILYVLVYYSFDIPNLISKKVKILQFKFVKNMFYFIKVIVIRAGVEPT